MALSVVRAVVQDALPEDAADNLNTHKLKGYYTEHGKDDSSVSVQSAERELSQEQMQAVLHNAMDTAESLFETMARGQTAPYPLKGAVDGCKYCPYQNACGYLSGVTPHRFVCKAAGVAKEGHNDSNTE